MRWSTLKNAFKDLGHFSCRKVVCVLALTYLIERSIGKYAYLSWQFGLHQWY